MNAATISTFKGWRAMRPKKIPRAVGVPKSRAVAPQPRTENVRHHMNHGGGNFMSAPPPVKNGPREPLPLGFEASKATQNILRLLESSHGVHNYGVPHSDTYNPSFHSEALSWVFEENGQWVARRTQSEMSSVTASAQKFPSISWMKFSDDRTAMLKLEATDGSERYLSLLRLEEETPGSPSPMANDGWVIVREVHCPKAVNGTAVNQIMDMKGVLEILETYLQIEHGGGKTELEKAKALFASKASLVSVGMAPPEEPASAWSAPAGRFLEIPLKTYLEGVEQQSPHSDGSRKNDAIVQIDLCNGGGAAAATVRVGNGAQTLVFVDHLLLGKTSTGKWTILSKTFSPQFWAAF